MPFFLGRLSRPALIFKLLQTDSKHFVGWSASFRRTSIGYFLHMVDSGRYKYCTCMRHSAALSYSWELMHACMLTNSLTVCENVNSFQKLCQYICFSQHVLKYTVASILYTVFIYLCIVLLPFQIIKSWIEVWIMVLNWGLNYQGTNDFILPVGVVLFKEVK